MKVAFIEISNKEVNNCRSDAEIENNRLIFDKVEYLSKTAASTLNEYPKYVVDINSLLGKRIPLYVGTVADLTKSLADNDIDLVIASSMSATARYILELEENLPKIRFYVYNLRSRVTNHLPLYNYEDLVFLIDVHIENEYIFGLDDLERHTLPRIQLTRGCAFNCSYCTIQRGVTVLSEISIAKQFKRYKDFKWIYIGDATFGQSSRELEILQAYPSHKYIVQTAVKTVLTSDIKKWKDAGVEYVELGIEIMNDDVFKRFNKDQTIESIKEAIYELRLVGIKVIANILVNIKGHTSTDEDYLRLEGIAGQLAFLNIFNYADYGSTESYDRDEVTFIKSWNDASNIEENLMYRKKLFKLNKRLLNETDTQK